MLNNALDVGLPEMFVKHSHGETAKSMLNNIQDSLATGDLDKDIIIKSYFVLSSSDKWRGKAKYPLQLPHLHISVSSERGNQNNEHIQTWIIRLYLNWGMGFWEQYRPKNQLISMYKLICTEALDKTYHLIGDVQWQQEKYTSVLQPHTDGGHLKIKLSKLGGNIISCTK